MPIVQGVKHGSVEELEAHVVHDTCAFMLYFLDKEPYACQEDWGERLDDDDILWEADFEPRDHGKTELFVVSYPLRKLCQNPNIRILIVKNTKQAAMKVVSAIKIQLERNERIKAFYQPYWRAEFGYDDICNADSREKEGQSTWGADRIYVKRTLISLDPTVEAVGVGGAITGGHYDIIILDDVEDPARLKTDEAYLDQIEWYTGTILQLREPWTKVVVVGTFKRASGDLYELVRNNPMYSATIQASIINPKLSEITYERVFNDAERLVGVKNIRPKNITVLCPEKWTIDRLIMDREGALTPGMTDNTWRREKMNDLTAFKEGIFKRHWFQNRYPINGIRDIEDCGVIRPFFRAIITGWDTAHTEKKTSSGASFSVGESIGIGPRGYYLLPDFYRAQVEYPELKRNVCGMYMRVRPNATIIEYKDSGIALVQELKSPFEWMGQWEAMPIIAYEPDSDKISRANSTTTIWESGMVWLPEDCSGDCDVNHPGYQCPNTWLPGWIERHVDFPETTWKDDVDVTSMLINRVQRLYPMHGMKNDFMPLSSDEDHHTQSRIIDMRKTLGPAGNTIYAPKHASRVTQLPMRGQGRTVRQLSSGRQNGEF